MNLQDTTKERALALLSNNVPNVSVARALGVSESYISQLIADADFSTELQSRRFDNLQKHTERDKLYDAIEDKLLNKLEKNLPLMHKPGEILKAIQVINGAKRRGAENGAAPQTSVVVAITLPSRAVTDFISTPQNQVIQAGHQELVTIQSGALLNEVRSSLDQIGEQNGKQPKQRADKSTELQARLGITIEASEGN